MRREGWVILLLLSIPMWWAKKIGDTSKVTNEDHEEHFKKAEDMYNRIHDELKGRYDRRIRPYIGVKPVEVDVFLYVSSLRSISEATMDYKLELYFREYWQDGRMAYNPKQYNNMTSISLHESYADLIWVPDTFLPNAVHSENPDHKSITHRALLRLEPDGHLLYSRRLSVTAECPMDLSLYPFDQQVCKLSIESYGYGIDDILYRWVEKEPIVLNQNLQLPDFKIKAVLTKSHNVTLATGTYSRLEACFFFVRSSAFYFVQLFIPATAIVVTSWLSLAMEGESTFSDMVEVILAITFLYYSYNTVMPRVSYIKAMDIYLGACFIFVFLSLIKLAILKMMRHHGERKEWMRTGRSRRIRGSRRLRTRYDPLDRDQYARRYQQQWYRNPEDEQEDINAEEAEGEEGSAFEMINRAYVRTSRSPSAPTPPTTANVMLISSPTTAASTPSGGLIGSHSMMPSTILSTPRLGKTSSRAAPPLYSQLSLDASERYRSPSGGGGGSLSSVKPWRFSPSSFSNGVAKSGVGGTSRRGSNGGGGGRRLSIGGRVADLFANKRFPLTPVLPARGARFRKMYKKMWVLLFPMAFVGFCIFYFFRYFLLVEDTSQAKCHF